MEKRIKVNTEEVIKKYQSYKMRVLSKTKGDNIMEQAVIKVAEKAIYNAINSELVGYDKPLSKFVNSVMMNHENDFTALINEGVSELLNANDFKTALKKALHDKLAKILVSKMGGELEKKVNELKQDATTRAKITLAIDKVMDEVLSK